MSSVRAPRWSRRLLSLCLPADDRRFALADLEEELERRTTASGVRTGRRWYRRQALRSVVPALRDRWARRPRRLAGVAFEDIRFALRSIARSPMIATVTVASLAVGIAAATTVFTAANAFLLRAPSSEILEPEALVAVFTSDNDGGAYGQSSWLDFEDIRTQIPAFEVIAAHRIGLVEISAGEATASPRRFMIEIVTGNYFDILGVRLPLGRAFLPEETVFGRAERVVVISHRLWQEELGGDPGVVGRELRIDGDTFVVIGVAPADLASRFLALRTDAWVPIGMPGGIFRSTERELSRRGSRDYGVIGRLRDDATRAQAQSQLDVAAARLLAEHPRLWRDDREQPRRFTAMDERAARVPPDAFAALTATSSIILLAACLILAIACSNVAGIMLARADQRRAELAVRLALGASRRRVVSLLLTESCLLAAAAGALGLVLATWFLRAYDSVALPIADFSLQFDLRMDGRVLAFAALLSLLTSVTFGMAPALRGSKADLLPALKGRSGGDAGGRLRMRNFLVLAQVAAALIFVSGAGITLATFEEMQSMSWGVVPDRIAVMSQDLPEELSEDALRSRYAEIIATLESHPEVERAHIGRVPEGTSMIFSARAELSVDGYERNANERMSYSYNAVTPGYLETLGIELIAGRTFAPADGPGAPRVAIVSEELARRFWPGRSAIGQRFAIGPGRQVAMGDERSTEYEVVGVAADASYEGFESDDGAFFWISLLQAPAPSFLVVAKGRTSAAALLPVLRAASDPDQNDIQLITPRRYADLIGFQFAFLRVIGRLLGWAGAFGMLLAMMGIYGVVSYAVTRRTREMAIRQAVGALPAQVARLVMRDGVRLALWGMVAGTAVVVPLSAILRADLGNISPIDPRAMLLGALLLLAAAALACVLPARRVTRADPVVSLRAE